MSFTTITKCNACLREFTDNSWMDHDCRTKAQIEEAKAEQAEWDKKFDYWNRQEERLGMKHAIMSVYEVKANDRAVEGKCVLVHRDYADGHKPYVSRVLNNPTWGTVLKHFDEAIEVTGDFHHRFLEGVGEIENGLLYVNRDLPEDCRVFTFWTGS